jgi:hypothetical protein
MPTLSLPPDQLLDGSVGVRFGRRTVRSAYGSVGVVLDVPEDFGLAPCSFII